MASIDNSQRGFVKRFGTCVLLNEPMKHHTSLRVGGPADVFIIPETSSELRAVVQMAGEQSLPLLVIGNGTNLLVKDGGIRGIVVSLKKCLGRIRHRQTAPAEVMVRAETGVNLSTLCRYAADRGLAGMNFAVGIPGTVGGALCMNAGTSRGWIGEVTASIIVLSADGRRVELGRSALCFSYRRLVISEPSVVKAPHPPIIMEADFILETASKKRLQQEARAILQNRHRRQPIDTASAGCIFKNPGQGPGAGELIDKAGLKGRRIGGAEISSRHANFIFNRGHATAADMLNLISDAQAAVLKAFNIQLETEVKIVGT